MRVDVQQDANAVSKAAASKIAKLVSEKPNCVLGLATGSTPLGTYQELIRLHRNEGLDFWKVTTFNLDEYVGLAADHPQSYRHFMNENLFRHLNIQLEQTHVPNGMAEDFDAACASYERKIELAGGIDLQLLGVGSDGHIAFNEPGSSLGSRTRIKSLVSETISDNARFFDSKSEVPTLAITMGVGTILDARQCLLIATGGHKADAVQQTIEGPVTSQITASALQLHPSALAIVDEQAASGLKRVDYYRRVEQAQREIEFMRYERQQKALSEQALSEQGHARIDAGHPMDEKASQGWDSGKPASKKRRPGTRPNSGSDVSEVDRNG